MKKIYALIISVVVLGGVAQAQFPIALQEGSLEMRINKVEGDRLFGFVNVEISVRSNGNELQHSYCMENEDGNVYAAFALVNGHDYIHIGRSYDKNITSDIWVKIGMFGFYVDTTVSELTTLRFGVKPGRWDDYVWFDFKNVPIAWKELPAPSSYNIQAEPLLPNGRNYVAATNLKNYGTSVSVVGNAQNGDLAVVFFYPKRLSWTSCFIVDESGMNYMIRESDQYSMKAEYRPREMTAEGGGTGYNKTIVYINTMKNQKSLKAVKISGYNLNNTVKDIPIQWITPKKKASGTKSGGTTNKPAAQKKPTGR